MKTYRLYIYEIVTDRESPNFVAGNYHKAFFDMTEDELRTISEAYDPSKTLHREQTDPWNMKMSMESRMGAACRNIANVLDNPHP